MLSRRLLATFVALLLLPTIALAADRPNILWITAEDMSPTLGCYGDTYAITPHIDRLARQSVLYTRAFATAPVCSPSRACLINGVYTPTQGTHQMRSAFPLPEHMTGFPSFLRKAGYYTTNNVKTDYNSANWDKIIKASWDENSDAAHWRNRKDKSKPFFSIFNLMTSHQSRSMVWPYEQFQKDVQSKLSKDEIHDPAKAPLPAYYVDTPVVRKTVARFYDCVTAMDKEVGAILKQLEEDGLADNTSVFFYSDHGSGMPRHKRALLDSGMHVPLLVRFPKKWQHLAPAKPGEKTDRLVSFVDFGPTVLSLTEVDIPQWMQGQPFLGKKAGEPRRYVFGHRDRVDEVMDMARSVRDGRYLYIRNFMPHLGYNQPTAWPDQGEIRHEFYRLTDKEKMTAAKWHFAGPTRPREELYDCVADPQNLKNLVDSAEHRGHLDRLRTALADHRLETHDLGYIPEAELWERISGGKTPIELPGTILTRREQLELILAASQVGHSTQKQRVDMLKSEIPGVRYWAAVCASAADKLLPQDVTALTKAMEDDSVSVRIEAASALARHDTLVNESLSVLAKSLEHKNLAAVQHAARSIELLGEKAKSLVPDMRKLDARLKALRPEDVPATVVQPGDLDMAMFIGFSTQAFLNRFGNTDTGAAKDWINLFDGRSLAGWNTEATKEGEVTIKDDEIHLLTKRNLWFAHKQVLGDFELEVEAFMPNDGYNSGIGFRCQTAGKFTGYQCEIAGDKSGSIYAIAKGWVWPKNKDETTAFQEMAGDSFKEGQWNTFRVICEGDHVRIFVNGVKTADLRDKLFDKGVIAIQHHGKGDVHRFRNIRIRELNAGAKE